MNPAMMPDGFDYADYMHVCKAMIEVCDTIVLLPDWKDSNGAKFEYGHASALGKRIITLKEAMNPSTIDEEE